MKNFLSIIFILFTCFHVFAQSSEFEKREGKIYKLNQLYTGEYIVMNEKKTESVFEIKEGVEDGKVIHYYPNKKTREIGFYKAGNKDGKWEKWDENGNKIGEAYYENSLKSGTWLVWDHQQQQRNEMHYKDGNRFGTWKVWDETGKLIQEKAY